MGVGGQTSVRCGEPKGTPIAAGAAVHGSRLPAAAEAEAEEEDDDDDDEEEEEEEEEEDDSDAL